MKGAFKSGVVCTKYEQRNQQLSEENSTNGGEKTQLDQECQRKCNALSYIIRLQAPLQKKQQEQPLLLNMRYQIITGNNIINTMNGLHLLC